MNEQSSKKILFNKSTLFNLKAELLKKQEEVLEKKRLPQNKVENYKPPVHKPDKEKSEDTFAKKSFKDGLKAVDVEELEACRKSKAALEKKAELYEHLVDGAGNSQLADRFLVDFKTKKQEEVREELKNKDSDDEVQEIDDGPDGWTEFTDCLGRTRKCHKSDLEMFKKRDLELRRATFKDDSDVPEDTPEIQEEKKEPSLLVQKTNDYLQSLRDKWEDKEREMLGQDRDIHYQDLLFDEARIHGVGYYSFSTDEKERRKQMDELIKTREQTLQAQKEAEEVRKRRDELMAARVKAARARQRARAGLPPEEEPEEDRESFTTKLLEFLTKQRDEAESIAKEKEKKQKEESEKERQKLREAYIREWDVGKDGVEGKVKKFREMTQEEYVAQQRDKRIDEFAPQQSASSSKSNYTFDNSGNMVGNYSLPAKTWSDVRPKAKTPPPIDLDNIDVQKGLYFSSKKQKDETEAAVSDTPRPKTPTPPVINIMKKEVKYRNFVRSGELQEVTPIVNELSDDEGENEVDVRTNDKRKADGTEIAPPPTYDYYGPIPKKVKQQTPFQSDIHEAYAQGAKSLEAKSSARQISKEYDFTFG